METTVSKDEEAYVKEIRGHWQVWKDGVNDEASRQIRVEKIQRSMKKFQKKGLEDAVIRKINIKVAGEFGIS